MVFDNRPEDKNTEPIEIETPGEDENTGIEQEDDSDKYDFFAFNPASS